VLNGLDLGSVECRVCPGETLESSALLLLLIGFPLCTVVGLVSSLALVVFGVVLFSRFDAL